MVFVVVADPRMFVLLQVLLHVAEHLQLIIEVQAQHQRVAILTKIIVVAAVHILLRYVRRAALVLLPVSLPVAALVPVLRVEAVPAVPVAVVAVAPEEDDKNGLI